MWQAKLKISLDEVALHYVPGCIGYYDMMHPNPWQTEHDVLESMMKIGNDIDIKKAIAVFETNCKGLIAKFKK